MVDKPDANIEKVRRDLCSMTWRFEGMARRAGGRSLGAQEDGPDKLEETHPAQPSCSTSRRTQSARRKASSSKPSSSAGRGSWPRCREKGTLHVGDIFVAGGEWAKYPRLARRHGPGGSKMSARRRPSKVLVLNGTPLAATISWSSDSEARAREVHRVRQRKSRDGPDGRRRGTLEQG